MPRNRILEPVAPSSHPEFIPIPDKNDPTLPQETWTKVQLENYCKDQCKRSALEAWKLGRALHFAREIYVMRRHWKTWLKANCPGLAYPTLMRYKALYEKTKDEEGIKEMNISESYERTKITHRSKDRLQRIEAIQRLNKLLDEIEVLAKTKKLKAKVQEARERLREGLTTSDYEDVMMETSDKTEHAV